MGIIAIAIVIRGGGGGEGDGGCWRVKQNAVNFVEEKLDRGGRLFVALVLLNFVPDAPECEYAGLGAIAVLNCDFRCVTASWSVYIFWVKVNELLFNLDRYERQGWWWSG